MITYLERALIVRKEPLDKILYQPDPKKWEMRSSKTSVRGWVGLIEAGSGLVVGATYITDSPDAIDMGEAVCSQGKHKVKNLSLLIKWKFPWVLSRSYRFIKPFKYEHPKGAVIWVNISHLNIGIFEPGNKKAISSELSAVS